MATPTDLNQEIMISVYLRRDKHENGMTLQEYTDAVIAKSMPILTRDQFAYQFGAIEDEVAVVTDWATAQGLTVLDANSSAATVKILGTAGQYNTLFKIELQNAIDGDRTYLTHSDELIVPVDIDDVVNLIAGLDNSMSFHSNAAIDPTVPGPVDPNVISNPTPVDLAAAYKFPSSPGNAQSQGAGACVAIIELGGGWTTQNLTSTFSRIGLANPIVVDVLVDGGVNNPADAGPSGEVMLDIYCVGAVIPSGKIAMYFAPNTFQGFIDTIIAATNDRVNNPSVISVSWGTTDTNWSTPSRQAFDAALQASIVQGITTFVAIGDYGTQAISGGPTYTVQYPGTSPYVISSGGTVITINNDYTIASEVVWKTGTSFATGGGYSSIYSIPSWQSGKGYSYKTYPGGTVTTLTTRGVPDVSAMATGYSFYYSSSNLFGTFLGTSAVAPLLAGMMARINQLSGRRIGFVNASWYGASGAFNDITVGDNAAPAAVGYSGTVGWDACTGLGSPIGTALFNLVNVGPTFPTTNIGFRPTSGQVYPRVDYNSV
jgi:kumamolisin